MSDEPILHKARIQGIELAIWEWPGAGNPILLVHASGFHGRCWDQVIRNLPGRICYAVDLRGHGLSDKPEPPYVWRSFGSDIAAVAELLSLSNILAVGHSVGGHAVTVAAALKPELFATLLLLDPVIFPSSMYTGPSRGEHFAARRRNQWASPNEMFERFQNRLPFSRWEPAVLRDYCHYGLLPVEHGGYVLACPPQVEASVYMNAIAANIEAEIAAIANPVHVVRGKQGDLSRRQAQDGGPTAEDLSASPTDPDLARRFKHGADHYLPHLSHFIPMEDPELVARLVVELAEKGSIDPGIFNP